MDFFTHKVYTLLDSEITGVCTQKILFLRTMFEFLFRSVPRGRKEKV